MAMDKRKSGDKNDAGIRAGSDGDISIPKTSIDDIDTSKSFSTPSSSAGISSSGLSTQEGADVSGDLSAPPSLGSPAESRLGAGTQDAVSELQKAAQRIPDAIAAVVDQAIADLQPRIHDAVNDIANRAVEYSHQAAGSVAEKARRNPWYVVGGVTLLLVGLGMVFGWEDQRAQDVGTNELH